MKTTPTESIGFDEAMYGKNIDESNEEIIKGDNKKKKQNDDFKENEIINERDISKNKDKKKKLVVTPSKSKLTDDIVVRTTADMSPYCKRLIDEAAISLDTSFETAFVHISSSVSDKVFSELLPIYNDIRNYLIPAFKISIEDEDSDLGFTHTHIYKKYDEREHVKVTLMLHSSVYTRVKAHTLVFSINNSDVFEYMVYNYFLGLPDESLSSETSNSKVKEVCKRRSDYFVQHIMEKVEEQKGLSKEEMSDLRRLSSKIRFLGIEKASVINDYMNVVFTGKSINKYKNGHSDGIFKKKTGRKPKRGER